jgi:hypothetical protein
VRLFELFDTDRCALIYYLGTKAPQVWVITLWCRAGCISSLIIPNHQDTRSRKGIGCATAQDGGGLLTRGQGTGHIQAGMDWIDGLLLAHMMKNHEVDSSVAEFYVFQDVEKS